MTTTTATTRRPRRVIYGNQRARRVTVLALLAVLLVPLSFASLFVGSKMIEPHTVWAALTAFDAGNTDEVIVISSRLPRTLIAIFAGAALGLAGALMQSLTRNALAEPGTLGINSGAAAGVVIGLFVLGPREISVYVWFAFAGAALASAVVYRLGRVHSTGTNPVRLVLAGAALTIMISAIVHIVVLTGPPIVFDSFRGWATGSLDGRRGGTVIVITACLIVGALVCAAVAMPLNSVLLGGDLARGLGVNIRRTWAMTTLGIIILAGGATAACGPLIFVGLAAPHIARSLGGHDHRWLLAYSAVIAAVVLLVADVAGRIVAPPVEIGAGVMTAFIGAPFFIWLIRRGKVQGL